MQYVLLAGGNSSRFWPYSESRHKSFIKVGGKSIVSVVISKLKGEVILVAKEGQNVPDDIGGNFRVVYQKESKGMYC